MSETLARACKNPWPEKDDQENQFPDGMRVLAVDDNIVCLKMLVVLLQKCRYKVMATTKAIEALKLLRENKNSFDIVITDVKMLDMDGFTLLEIISLEMDIPVIMLSASDDRNTVMKGIKSGARDYLLKPPRMEEIKNIWQHVIRKNLFGSNMKLSIKNEVMDEKPPTLKRGIDKIKVKAEDTNNQTDGNCSAQKRPRVHWTRRMHGKFVDAVQQLGVDSAVPKRILQLMDEPGLTRENVASHLQKFRNMLKKHDAETSQKSESNVDSNRMGGHLPKTAFLSFDKLGTDAANQLNRSELPGFPMGKQIAQPGRFSSSLMNPRPFLFQPNQQDMLLQAHLHPSQLVDQVQPKLHASGLGDAPLIPSWMRVPDFKWLDHQSYYSQFKQLGDYMQISSHTPGYSASCDPGPSSFWPVGCAPNSIPSGANFDLPGLPYQILGNGASGISRVAGHDSAVRPVPNFSPVQNEGRNFLNFDVGEDPDIRGRVNGCPPNMQGPVMENSAQNGLKRPAQYPPEDVETETSSPNSCSSTEDDLSVMVKQFNNNNAAPHL